jgi:hypothetical protein
MTSPTRLAMRHVVRLSPLMSPNYVGIDDHRAAIWRVFRVQNCMITLNGEVAGLHGRAQGRGGGTA